MLIASDKHLDYDRHKAKQDDGVFGRIHSVETMGTVDGPGLRYVLFLQGCMFRCLYCHNRDTWDFDGGHIRTTNHVARDMIKYKPFVINKGGVTVTGGEPLLQIEFVTDLFRQLKKEGIHTCLDTNGYALHYDQKLDDLMEVTDLVLLDLKQIDDIKHKLLTEVPNKHTLKFANYLSEREQPIWLRHVVVPGYSDDVKDVARFAAFAKSLNNVQKVELLPYHAMGVSKWRQLGYDYPLKGVEPPSREKMLELKATVEKQGLTVQMQDA